MASLARKKFNRIAVILIGHIRTFPRLNNYYHDFFNSMADNVDYFLLTWDKMDHYSSNSGIVPVEHYFGSRLKKQIVLNADECEINNFSPLDKTIKLTYLAKLGAIEKTKVEKEENFIYDYVVETRPDLYFNPPWDLKYYHLEDNEIILHGAVGFGPANSMIHDRKWDSTIDAPEYFALGDWYFRMNSITYDTFSNRYDILRVLDRDTTVDFHKELLPYFLHQQQFKFVIQQDWNTLWSCKSEDRFVKLPN